MQNDIEKYSPKGEMLIYRTEDGKASIDVVLENETVWLTQKQMAMLFDTTPQNMTMHLANIYKDGELSFVATCKEYLQVQIEGELNESLSCAKFAQHKNYGRHRKKEEIRYKKI